MSTAAILAGLDEIRPTLESIYKDIHAHPELSLQEERTSGIAAAHLRDAGFEVTERVGGFGVVGMLRNGNGPVVMLRADMDALPVREQSSASYASTVTATTPEGETVPVMHACGHDMHVTCLIGAAELLGRSRDAWQGTLMVVFQPAEELVSGANAMVEDRQLQRLPKPDVVLGQHVMVGSAGTIRTCGGPLMAAGDDLQIKFFGKAAHGSMPEAGIDPIVMASAAVLRLQTIVSREIAPSDRASLTVGVIRGGSAPNIIADETTIQLDMRSFDEQTRSRLLEAVERIAVAEARASGATQAPEITVLNSCPVTVNDHDTANHVMTAFRRHFGEELVEECAPIAASEDFGIFGSHYEVPSLFWFIGGTDPEVYRAKKKAGRINDIPTNHNPEFLPVIQPTLDAGIGALVVAACACMTQTGRSPRQEAGGA